MLLIAILASALQSPAAPPPPAAPPASRFGGLFTDWRGANDEALESEQARVRGLPPEGASNERQARSLGTQVGEMVALGDCDGGERVAREAGDLVLLRAVQDHCRRQASLARSGRRVDR
jgi:hypothetical protein